METPAQKKYTSHGFSRGINLYQLGSYTFILVKAFFFFFVIIPNIRLEYQITFTLLYMAAILATIILGYKTTIHDPTDEVVKEQRRCMKSGEEFDTKRYEFQCVYCETCVSENSKHCKQCNRCVRDFDHHCKWVNNCIDKKIYKKFIALVFAAMMATLLYAIFGIMFFIDYQIDAIGLIDDYEYVSDQNAMKPLSILIMVLSVFNLFFCIMNMKLLNFHRYLIKHNMSTYDYIILLKEKEKKAQKAKVKKITPLPTTTGTTEVNGSTKQTQETMITQHSRQSSKDGFFKKVEIVKTKDGESKKVTEFEKQQKLSHEKFQTGDTPGCSEVDVDSTNRIKTPSTDNRDPLMSDNSNSKRRIVNNQDENPTIGAKSKKPEFHLDLEKVTGVKSSNSQNSPNKQPQFPVIINSNSPPGKKKSLENLSKFIGNEEEQTISKEEFKMKAIKLQNNFFDDVDLDDDTDSDDENYIFPDPHQHLADQQIQFRGTTQSNMEDYEEEEVDFQGQFQNRQQMEFVQRPEGYNQEEEEKEYDKNFTLSRETPIGQKVFNNYMPQERINEVDEEFQQSTMVHDPKLKRKVL